MKKPLVVIMGRPNVGKSTLLNRLIGKRAAITLDEPGMTRDLLSYDWIVDGAEISLMDTGGVFLNNTKEDFFQQEIENKVQDVLTIADVIFFVVDAKEGLHPFDQQIMKVLQRVKQKVWLLVNKVDEIVHQDRMYAFHGLGIDTVHAVSAAHGKGISALKRSISSYLQLADKSSHSDNPLLKLSILGQPNTGKSSLANALFGKDFVIVSEQAGTTRDVVNVPVCLDGEKYLLLDTAGLRRKSKVSHPIEFFSGLRARQTILEANVCMVLIDATNGIAKQDKRILQLVLDEAKPLIVVINKWDEMPNDRAVMDDFKRICVAQMPRLEYYPFCFISAREKMRLNSLIKSIKNVVYTANQRITTSELNTFVSRVLSRHQPPGRTGKLNRIYYATQAEKDPPTFVFSVRDPDPIKEGYYRYVEKAIRGYFKGFEGVGMKLVFKRHHAKQDKFKS